MKKPEKSYMITVEYTEDGGKVSTTEWYNAESLFEAEDKAFEKYGDKLGYEITDRFPTE